MEQPAHLSEKLLARRWGLSHRTLERWRHDADGPAYLKIGGRVVYRLEDIEAFEAARARAPRTDGVGTPHNCLQSSRESATRCWDALTPR